MSEPTQTQRDQLMAALSAAEQLVAASPAAPTHIRVGHRSEWGYLPGFEPVIGVELYFHNAPDAVEAFGKAVSGLVVARPDEYDGVSHVDTVAEGEHLGVPFWAWARVDVPAEQMAAPAEVSA